MVAAHSAIVMNSMPANEKAFTSNHGGYSVRYPGTWNPFRYSISNTTNREDLDILSFPNSKRLEAIQIIHGGAEIILRRRAAVPPSKEDEFLSRNTVSLAGPCATVDVLESRWEVGPETFERDVSMACKTAKAQYELSVRMWDDDPKHEQYKAVGLRILESLQERSAK